MAGGLFSRRLQSSLNAVLKDTRANITRLTVTAVKERQKLVFVICIFTALPVALLSRCDDEVLPPCFASLCRKSVEKPKASPEAEPLVCEGAADGPLQGAVKM